MVMVRKALIIMVILGAIGLAFGEDINRNQNK